MLVSVTACVISIAARSLVEPITEAGRRELFLIYNNHKLKIIRLEQGHE